MSRGPEEANTDADLEWERAPGEARLLPWLFGDGDPEDAPDVRLPSRTGRWWGRRRQPSHRG